MPAFYFVSAGRQAIDYKFSSSIRYSEVRTRSYHDVGTLPGMEHITLDLYDSLSIQALLHLSPAREPDIEKSLSAEPSMSVVKN